MKGGLPNRQENRKFYKLSLVVSWINVHSH